MISATPDTNVVISALQFGGIPRRILDLAEAGTIRLAVSPAILEEVADVLQRKKIGWSASETKGFIEEFYHVAEVVQPRQVVEAIQNDPDDNRILECAITAQVDYVITGDKHLLKLEQWGRIQIVKPADFLALVSGTEG